MKAFHAIDCNCLDQISIESISWIRKNTDLLNINPEWHQGNFWNKINYKDFLSNNPTLINFCLSINLKIREVAILSAHKDTGVKLHVDEGPVISKINFPILNTKDTYTEWYDVDLTQIDPTINQFGQSFYNLHELDVDQEKKIAEIEMISPIVFNSSIPHRVRIGPTAKLPRIVISCMFFNEPLDYLNE